MKVSVVIPTYNRCPDLKCCLDSLIVQTYKNFEIIVADDSSTDETKELVEQYSAKFPIRFVTREKKGLVFARNLGWQIANGDIVSYIDDDAVASPAWLKEIVNSFTLSDRIGGVSGPTIIPNDRLIYRDFLFFYKKNGKSYNLLRQFIGKVYKSVILEGKSFDVGRIFKSGMFSPGSNLPQCLKLRERIEVDYLEACNMSYRRSILKKIGGFDNRYIGTAEWHEPDLCFRIKKLGHKLIFNPKAKVEHHVSQSGVYGERANAHERVKNFIYFYFKNIKPNSIDKALRFGLYLSFLNIYWFYKATSTKNANWLTGVTATLKGLLNPL